ncbi:lysylphosphatidylglycerol synthase transmembrane domain-containing protein [Enterococcus wangshanyuanii]|uniref:Phosphatidylglycerol lysyltransferase n=1 Tax=Enterococcus wangshanyuanii TaxID=2005703 RepID=A0ABQ1NXZ1_9ENTE|nr:lysylphosphatidylglycerol synthase domain-containing protein [Enterococcus wangshanyuanii]GGC85645.1 phosphatidylglycerol lysyltransferase [Enterococcus wangshanyuanii]
MKSNSKTKIFLNIGLLAIFVGVIIYVMDNSLSDIFAQLMETSWLVLLLVIILGVVYQFVEGRSIKEIAGHFQKDFTTKDGFFTSCYVAFYRVISFGTGTLLSEIYFYKKKGLAVSQGIGVTALHMIMYKLAVIFWAILGLIFQFSLFYERSPKMIPFILAGVILTFLIILSLLVLSSSINLQILLITWANKFFKRKGLRDWVDKCNLQIYSLRETVQTIIKDRSAILRIFGWNVVKLLFWYVIPYVVLVENHPNIDFLLVFSFTSFAVILSGVFPTPAGIGPFEFVYLLLFKPLVGTVDAVSSLLLYRFGSFVLPFLIGFIFVVVEKRREIQSELHAVRKEKRETLEDE